MATQAPELIDLHCHILPGLDDGPATLDESLAMARMAAADGVRIIVATPHVDRELKAPDPDLVRHLVTRLNKALQGEGVPLRVLPGGEVPAEPDLVEALQSRRVLTIGDLGHHVLVELPMTAPAMYAPQLLFRMQLAGFTPVIAHVERAAIFRQQPAMLEEFRNRGYGLQLNVDSLTAGWSTRRYARGLLHRGLVTILASDAHDTQRRRPLLSPARHVLRSQPDLFEQLTLTNPRELLRRPKDHPRREEKGGAASPMKTGGAKR